MANKESLPNKVTTSVILQLTKFILELNHFKFKDKHRLQKKRQSNGNFHGTSIGKYFHGLPGGKDYGKINPKTKFLSALY